jgi:hypothetical protein
MSVFRVLVGAGVAISYVGWVAAAAATCAEGTSVAEEGECNIQSPHDERVHGTLLLEARFVLARGTADVHAY